MILPLVYGYMVGVVPQKGISLVQLSKDIGVTQKTAWFMLHRIRKALGIDNDKTDVAGNDTGRRQVLHPKRSSI